MHANVLFPINSEAFTYFVPEELRSDIKIGSRVEVPFKRSCKTGIVVALDRNHSSSSLIKGEPASTFSFAIVESTFSIDSIKGPKNL